MSDIEKLLGKSKPPINMKETGWQAEVLFQPKKSNGVTVKYTVRKKKAYVDVIEFSFSESADWKTALEAIELYSPIIKSGASFGTAESKSQLLEGFPAKYWQVCFYGYNGHYYKDGKPVNFNSNGGLPMLQFTYMGPDKK